MKKFVLAVTLAASTFAMSASAGTWTGFIGDSKCAAKHNATEGADCAVKCVKGGAAPVFISDGKVYKIANTDKVMEHVGHKVTITGDVKDDTVTVESVKM